MKGELKISVLLTDIITISTAVQARGHGVCVHEWLFPGGPTPDTLTYCVSFGVGYLGVSTRSVGVRMVNTACQVLTIANSSRGTCAHFLLRKKYQPFTPTTFSEHSLYDTR